MYVEQNITKVMHLVTFIIFMLSLAMHMWLYPANKIVLHVDTEHVICRYIGQVQGSYICLNHTLIT